MGEIFDRLEPRLRELVQETRSKNLAQGVTIGAAVIPGLGAFQSARDAWFHHLLRKHGFRKGLRTRYRDGDGNEVRLMAFRADDRKLMHRVLRNTRTGEWVSLERDVEGHSNPDGAKPPSTEP